MRGPAEVTRQIREICQFRIYLTRGDEEVAAFLTGDFHRVCPSPADTNARVRYMRQVCVVRVPHRLHATCRLCEKEPRPEAPNAQVALAIEACTARLYGPLCEC
jgi:hypothetical protein